MKKAILALLVLTSWTPYLFLATDVQEVELTSRDYNCVVQTPGILEEYVSWTRVYMEPLRDSSFLEGSYKLMPGFFRGQKYYTARCGDKEVLLGSLNDDWIKPGEKINVYTRVLEIKFFGKTIDQIESLNGFGTGWGKPEKEGEIIAKHLHNGKVLKLFGGKVIGEEK